MKTTLKVLALVLCAGAAMAEKEDAGHGKDYRTFHANGEIEYESIDDSYTSDLVMYLAGNQFMVMQELITDFQQKNPDIETVYVETIPPGQILKNQLLKQGDIEGQQTAMNPDIFASVNIGHLKRLKGEGLMEQHAIYIGNPKNIAGPEDLGRDDLVQSHPNPLTEGIFKFYGSEMLKDLDLHEKVTAGAECRSCWAIEGKTWFTSRHRQGRGASDRWRRDSGAVEQAGQGQLRHWHHGQRPQSGKRQTLHRIPGYR
jgi:hypothetical protein